MFLLLKIFQELQILTTCFKIQQNDPKFYKIIQHFTKYLGKNCHITGVTALGFFSLIIRCTQRI